jgi:ABC-2 type transport system permease protein
MFKFLIRISSFLGKELTEIFRQPRLILTMVLGPFLIMFLFGLAYPDQSRSMRTTFVVANPDAFSEEMGLFTKAYNSTIINQGVETDKNLALSQLALNQTDLVIVIPDAPFETIQNNQQATLEIYHNEVDPFQIAYIQTVSSIYVNEVNRLILQDVAEQGQEDTGSVQGGLEAAITKIQTLRQALPAGDNDAATQAQDLENELTSLHENLTTFRSMASGILVNPFGANVNGLSDVQFSVNNFFAPAVIALLLQHLSITFAALSIVRERRSGIMELFRVSPITAFETLVGKFVSYLFFEALLAAAITALAIWVLRIPILGNWQDYALAVLILLFTSLGMGFLISLVSQTDTQAVQYSMLLLLASIFFSGFFLDLRLMWEPMRFLAWSLPATYGIRMLQDVMLRGASVSPMIFQGIAIIGVVLFLIDWLLLRRRMEVN